MSSTDPTRSLLRQLGDIQVQATHILQDADTDAEISAFARYSDELTAFIQSRITDLAVLAAVQEVQPIHFRPRPHLRLAGTGFFSLFLLSPLSLPLVFSYFFTFPGVRSRRRRAAMEQIAAARAQYGKLYLLVALMEEGEYLVE